MFKAFWKYLSKIGIKPHYDEVLQTRVALTNQFTFIATFIFLLSGINNYVLGDVYSGLLIESLMLVCIATILLNKYGRHKLSTFVLFGIISLAAFYFCSYSGMNSGTFLYYFPLFLALAFIFDVKTEKTEIAVYFIINLFLIILNLSTHYALFKSALINEEMQYQMFVFNLLFSILSVGFFIYLTIQNGVKERDVYALRILEREISEKTIRQTLSEKDILLAELHHRVKNNLAVIIGLFNLKIDSVSSNEAKDILNESKDILRSMALIHNKLYRSNSFSEIDFNEYILDLVREIRSSYPELSNHISIETDISQATLNINEAVPCGLILNEVILNCYKHAFKNKQDGKIIITLKVSDRVALMVKDNGNGFPENINEGESFGMTVIRALCEQLDSTFSFKNNNGAVFEMSFAIKNK